MSNVNVKNIYRRRRMSRVRIGGAGATNFNPHETILGIHQSQERDAVVKIPLVVVVQRTCVGWLAHQLLLIAPILLFIYYLFIAVGG